jgi:hypothetical protein
MKLAIALIVTFALCIVAMALLNGEDESAPTVKVLPRTIVSWGSRAFIEQGYPDVYHASPSCEDCPEDRVPMRTSHFEAESWRPCPKCGAARKPGEK